MFTPHIPVDRMKQENHAVHYRDGKFTLDLIIVCYDGYDTIVMGMDNSPLILLLLAMMLKALVVA